MELLESANLIQRRSNILRVTFRTYPLSSKESEAVEWGNSVNAIDEVNRRLNNTKSKKGKKK